jgi:hypothetical protein
MSMIEQPVRRPPGRPPGSTTIAQRHERIKMAADAAAGYSKVLAFWFEVLADEATFVDEGKTYKKYTTEDRFKASELIMAYGFGKPVQPLTAAYQEQRTQVLEVRWLPPDPNDKSKLIEPEPD